MKRSVLCVYLVALAACSETRGTDVVATQTTGAAAQVLSDSAFGRLVARLSEPGGYFDTDNLISNESSYLHVVEGLREQGVSGGAYLGVGPDQNFSYIAHVRPSVAFIVDIRRDNLLQHLMFKAIFRLAENRIEYLCLLFARPAPSDAKEWEDRELAALLAYVDATPAGPDDVETTLARVVATAAGFGVSLSEADRQTIRRFHASFIREGLELRFRSHGRQPRSYYPTYRRLLLERDRAGRQASYLAGEGDFAFVRSLQERNAVIPVVGDLAGDHALTAIGEYLAKNGERVSAFYTSNVEFYLMRGRGFDRFVGNVAALPQAENGVVIRSYFGRNFGYAHPQAVPGYYSVQLLQTMADLVAAHEAGELRSYFDLVRERAPTPR